MSNVPNKRASLNWGKNLQSVGDKRPPNVVRKLNTTGRKERYVAASYKGRQGGGGFPVKNS